MTAKESKEILLQVLYDDTTYTEQVIEAFSVALKALELQNEKMPISKSNDGHYENCSIVICPCCRKRLKLKSKGKFCDKCGQKLIWK